MHRAKPSREKLCLAARGARTKIIVGRVTEWSGFRGDNAIMRRFAMILRRGVFAAIALLLGSASAFAQVQIRLNQYSAKFLCGDAKELGTTVRPGNYETSINVHNPQFQAVRFVKKAVRSPREGERQFPRPEFRLPREPLEADFAEQIDCKLIRALLGPVGNDPFIEGFVVLIAIPSQQTNPEGLDVVGVYTVDTPQQSISLEIVPVPARVLTFGGAAGRRMLDQLQQSKPE
jgi:hypothetical protein